MNVPEWQTRTALLVGEDKLKKLRDSHVLIVGLGGVGGWAAELICRAGVGKMTVADGDVVDTTNRNRQLAALKSNVGKPKAGIIAARLRDINPEAEIVPIEEYLKDERLEELLTCQPYDYVVDAIDTLSPKVYLIKICLENSLKLVSSMGAGGKFNPGLAQVADIEKSYQCKLARAIRKRLHRFGIKGGFKVVFSPEENEKNAIIRLEDHEHANQKSIVGTISYMPPVFGIHCAATVVRDLTFE